MAPGPAPSGVDGSQNTANDFNEFGGIFVHKYYRELYHAALKGDWNLANKFDRNAFKETISVYGRTALHVAAIEGQSEFVRLLVKEMPAEAISLRDKKGNTALHYAAIDGNINSVKALVARHPALVQIENNKRWTPLICAVVNQKPENKEVIWFLSFLTQNEEPSDIVKLLEMLIYAGHYDISLYLFKLHPNLISVGSGAALSVLAKRPSDFPSGSRLGIWKSIIYKLTRAKVKWTPPPLIMVEVENHLLNPEDLMGKPACCICKGFGWMGRIFRKTIKCLAAVPYCINKDIRDEKLRHKLAVELVTYLCERISNKNYSYNELNEIYQLPEAMVSATTVGIVEIIKVCLEHFPDLIWYRVKKSMLQVAIEERQDKIFNLMNKVVGQNKMLMVIESEENNILHLVAKEPPSSRLSSVPGSAFQMQREMQWFKEVEKLVHPFRRDELEDHKTAWEAFTENRKVLVEKAEKWMKGTSRSCTVVSTLITTVAFAAAINVPGGYNMGNGIPNLLMDNSNFVIFLVFAIFDAVALVSSITSLLMFLSILTSRFAVEDFLSSLPTRMVIGVAFLFLAISTIMFAFGAALIIVLHKRWRFVFIPVAVVVPSPVVVFAMLHLPMFLQMFQSTRGWRR